MKFLEWIKERINKEDIKYFDYNEFGDIGDGDVKKANWGSRPVTLKNLKDLDDSKIIGSDENITKLKDLRRIHYHSNINRFFGLTKDLDGNYFSILEYANEGNLRDYLENKEIFDSLQWNDKIQMALDITSGLMCIHSKKIIHGNLHALNILVNDRRLKIADFKLFERMTEATSEFDNIVYVEPQYLSNPSYKQDMKSDIYSLGFLLWELSSGRSPFSKYSKYSLTRIKKLILNGKKEDPVGNTSPEYQELYQKCWQDDPNLRPDINEVFEILSKLKSQELPESSPTTSGNDSFMDVTSIAEITAEMFKKLRLHHGLFLDGYNVKPSKLAIFKEDSELNIAPYKGQPIVCTNINASDACISFPIAEITHNGDLLESFQKCTDDDKKSRELYGHFYVRKILVGGKLFIKDFNSATQTQKAQIDILKFYLFCAYNSAKYSTEIQFNDLLCTLNLLPKIETLDRKELNTHKKLADWMNDLYKNNTKSNLKQSVLNLIQKGKRCIDKLNDGREHNLSTEEQRKSIIISHSNLIPISQSTSSDNESGTVTFKEESLEEWVGDVGHGNLMSWARDLHLFRGLIINKNYEVKTSEKVAINFIKIPKDNDDFRRKSYLKMIKPLTDLEVFLISNNIFSIKDLSTFPFITLIERKDKSYKDYNHILVKHEQQEILLDRNIIKPTEEFEKAVEKALNDMKPLKALQDIFNEYGHLFPQRIILGRSLKNITSSTLINNIDEIDLNSSTLGSYLVDLNISYFLTPKGKIIEKNDSLEWIQDTNNLKIVEFDNIIPLYKILNIELQEKIDAILENNFRIIMTGITDLKDLDENNAKRINIVPSLENKDYIVLGSVISENNFKLEGIHVNFESYDFNGFYAIIKKLEETNFNITECYVLWMIIGKPSKLSVFSPNNREFKVDCFKRQITLQSNRLTYNIKTPSPLSQDYTILINASTNNELNDIKLIEWKYESMNVQIIISNRAQRNHLANMETDIKIDIDICILSTDSTNKCLNIEKGNEYSLDLIGHILTTENFNGDDQLEDGREEDDDDNQLLSPNKKKERWKISPISSRFLGNLKRATSNTE